MQLFYLYLAPTISIVVLVTLVLNCLRCRVAGHGSRDGKSKERELHPADEETEIGISEESETNSYHRPPSPLQVSHEFKIDDDDCEDAISEEFRLNRLSTLSFNVAQYIENEIKKKYDHNICDQSDVLEGDDSMSFIDDDVPPPTCGSLDYCRKSYFYICPDAKHNSDNTIDEPEGYSPISCVCEYATTSGCLEVTQGQPEHLEASEADEVDGSRKSGNMDSNKHGGANIGLTNENDPSSDDSYTTANESSSDSSDGKVRRSNKTSRRRRQSCKALDETKNKDNMKGDSNEPMFMRKSNENTEENSIIEPEIRHKLNRQGVYGGSMKERNRPGKMYHAMEAESEPTMMNVSSE